MSFNKVAIKRRNTVGWIGIFGQKRSMSNWRLIATAGTWIIALGAMYSSLFYVPAFINFNKTFGISATAPDVESESKSFLKPYKDLLMQNRTYLRQGQAMEAHYQINSPKGGKLLFFKCQSPIIIEVFRCNPQVVQTLPLRKSKGSYSVEVNTSGFYGFKIALANEEAKYDVVWRRRY